MNLPDLSTLATGSWPQWLLLLVVALGFIKWLIPWKHDEMRKMRAELKECEAECDRRLKKIEADLWGEKKQRVAEQISFINIILQSVDAPELQTMLRTLESVEAHLKLRRDVQEVGG